ncbi:MAG: hypothetical protein O8C67_05030 [Candidatus Methanoperedens sp.]|nr:hypothetical protein [Candidatus Methanoperedens sp.]
MVDLSRGLAPQAVREEEGNTDILNQILVELKRINTQLILITDNVIRDNDIIDNKEDVGP